MRDATARHIRSALRRLPEGGRMVVLTGVAHDPADADINALYGDILSRAAFVFTATVDGRIYARYGTTIDTRLTVVDRIPECQGSSLIPAGHAKTLSELLNLIETKLPPRPPIALTPAVVKNTLRARPSSCGKARSPPYTPTSGFFGFVGRRQGTQL